MILLPRNKLSCQSCTGFPFIFSAQDIPPPIAIFFFTYIIVRFSHFEGKDDVLYLFIFPVVPNKYMNYRINPKLVGFPSSFCIKNVDSSCIIEVSAVFSATALPYVGTVGLEKNRLFYFKVVTLTRFQLTPRFIIFILFQMALLLLYMTVSESRPQLLSP